MMDNVFEVTQELYGAVAKEQYTKGKEKYGTELEVFNGRDAGLDAFQELVDLSQYLTQLYLEYRTLCTILVTLDRDFPLLMKTFAKNYSHLDGIVDFLEVALSSEPELLQKIEDKIRNV